MNKILIINIIITIFSSTNVFAQVGGISNSKVVLPATGPVGAGDFEFEPAFDVFWYNQLWDNGGNLLTLSNTIRESGLGYRFTAGFEHDIEVGLIVPEDVSSLSFGLKWLFWKNNEKSFALQSGLDFESDDRVLSESEESMKVITNGLIFTYEPNEKLSIDTDATFSLYSTEINSQSVNYSGTFDIGVGYLLNNQFQAIVELNSTWISFDNSLLNSSKTNGTIGFTFYPNDGTVVIFGVKHDMFGTNDAKGVSFVGAFTFLMGK